MTQRPVLIVPGWTNSGPQHGQTLWEHAHPEYQRVELRDWETPERSDWIAMLDETIRAASSPRILVAHSLGCITIVHWAAERGHDADGAVAAALLVAPADVDAPTAPDVVRGFQRCRSRRFGFPASWSRAEPTLTGRSSGLASWRELG